MGTRANITVRDSGSFVRVYMHDDGYPNGAGGVLELVRRALIGSWVLPRFEADTFAAALVCEIQASASPGRARIVQAGDVATHVADRFYEWRYRYTVTRDGHQLRVVIDDGSDVEQVATITADGVNGGYIAPED